MIILFDAIPIRQTTILPITLAVSGWVPLWFGLTRFLRRYSFPLSGQLTLLSTFTRIDATLLTSLTASSIGWWALYLFEEHPIVRTIVLLLAAASQSSLFALWIRSQERARPDRFRYYQIILRLSALSSLSIWTLVYWRIGEYFFDVRILSVASLAFLLLLYYSLAVFLKGAPRLLRIEGTLALITSIAALLWLPIALEIKATVLIIAIAVFVLPAMRRSI